MSPYSQYIGSMSSNFPDEMGHIASSLIVGGASTGDVEKVLRCADLVSIVEQGNNLALANSNAAVLHVWLAHDEKVSHIVEKFIPSVASLADGEDWISWWSVSAAFGIAMAEQISVAEVLDVMSLDKIMKAAIK